MTAIGIDFGTSTTVAAMCGPDGQAKILKNAEGDEIVPSVVAFTPTGKVQVGRPARSRRLIDPQNALYSVKRVLGRQHRSAEVGSYQKAHAVELEAGQDGASRFVTRAGKLSAVDVVSYMLASLREYPDLANLRASHTVVTIPTSADEAQRKATISAAEQAGFANVSVLDEAHAAALAYLQSSRKVQTILVYDLGGGTFDLAVARGDGKSFETLSAAGDSTIGGDDIDLRCAGHLVQRILADHRWDVRTSAKSFQTLVFLCEQAKVSLSIAESHALSLGSVDQVLAGKSITLARSEVEKLCGDLVRRTFVLCDEVLARAGLKASDIDEVILAGGTTNMPVLRSGIQHYFGKVPLTAHPPDRIVALGAALEAARR